MRPAESPPLWLGKRKQQRLSSPLEFRSELPTRQILLSCERRHGTVETKGRKWWDSTVRPPEFGVLVAVSQCVDEETWWSSSPETSALCGDGHSLFDRDGNRHASSCDPPSALGTWTLTLSSPTGATTTGFVANGSVTSVGNAGFVQVQYEPTGTPITSTSPLAGLVIVNSGGTGSQPVSIPVDQLTPNTSYTYDLRPQRTTTTPCSSAARAPSSPRPRLQAQERRSTRPTVRPPTAFSATVRAIPAASTI